jgi:hypothetical protein
VRGEVRRRSAGPRVVGAHFQRGPSEPGASAARPNPARTLAARPVRIGPVRSTPPCFGCLIPEAGSEGQLVHRGSHLLPLARSSYRECVRHLWNTHVLDALKTSSDKWGLRDEFNSVCSTLFSALVVEPLGLPRATDFRELLARTRELSKRGVPWLHVVPQTTPFGVPIMINRDQVESDGYWDHPVRHVSPSDVTLSFVSWFDFDELAFRDFRYYRVRITSAARDEIVGRAALIECEHTSVFFDQSAADKS